MTALVTVLCEVLLNCRCHDKVFDDQILVKRPDELVPERVTVFWFGAANGMVEVGNGLVVGLDGFGDFGHFGGVCGDD